MGQSYVDKSNIDKTTTAIIEVSHSHHEIHSGNSYTTEDNASGGAGTKATITFKTPAGTKLIHMIAHYRSNVESHSTLGEGVTITADTGTNKLPTAKNRSNVVASILIGTRTAAVNNITYGATVTNFGTVLEIIHFGNGKQGGEFRGDDEWILKPDTIYALETESEAASSDVNIEMDWYEHPNH